MVDLDDVRQRAEKENHPYFTWWWKKDVLAMAEELKRLRSLAHGYPQNDGRVPYV